MSITRKIVDKQGTEHFVEVLAVEEQYEYQKVSRTTTDTNIGTGAKGDLLKRIIVDVVPTVANMTISDGGTVIATIATTANVGDVIEVGCLCTSNWQVDLHATGVGSITAIGRFS